MHHLNWLDFVILGVVLLSFAYGLFRGLIRELISLLTWIGAFVITFLFAKKVALYLSHFISSQTAATGISIFGLFITVLIIGALLNFIFGHLINKTGFSVMDHFFGGVFGLARGVFIIQFFVLIITMTSWQTQPWFQKSQLTYHLQGVSVWLQEHMIKQSNPH